MADALEVGVAIGLSIAVLSVFLALRYRVPYRIAVGNVRRARGRTALVVAGLLVATTIVSGSLVIGDTVNAVNVHFAYQEYGFTDEAVYNGSANLTYPFFPASIAWALSAGTRGDPRIAGVTPEVVGSTSAIDLATGVPQAGLNLVGVDPNASRWLGAFATAAGPSPGPSPGTVFLDDLAAGDLNASVGDTVALYHGGHLAATVAAIVPDDTRGGFLGGGTVFVPLATAQEIYGVSNGTINFIAVTNAGSLTAAAALSDPVMGLLNATLRSLAVPPALGAHAVLADALARATTAGGGLTTLFLALGLFSIVAGAMLVVGIFVMLAEERKAEMGMLRAIGLPRRQLTLVYYFEGLFYSAGSSAAGAALGVGVGYGLTWSFSVVFSSGSVSSRAILDSFTVATSSLVIAFVVGFLLTLITVSIASARVSRLNIVRALRAVPEPSPPLQTYTGLAYVGVALAAAGALLFAATYAGRTDVSLPIVGFALVLVGGGLVAARWLPDRFAFTATGVALLVWGGVLPLRRALLGLSHTGTIFVVFVEGILLILGALLVYGFNSELIVRAVTGALGRRPKSVPVVRIGLSYPSRRPFRTAVNLAIFSLVIFTVVAVASFGASIQEGLGEEIRVQSGGYTFAGFSQTPVPDLPGAIAANASLAPLFREVVPLTIGLASVAGPGFPAGYQDSVFGAPTNASPDQNLYTTNRYNFTDTWHGLSAAQAFRELAGNASVAIVDASYAAGGVNFGFGPPHPSVRPGDPLRITNDRTGAVRNVTVIGILSEQFVSGVFLNPGTVASLGYAGAQAFLIQTAPGVPDGLAAQRLKVAFFPFGLQLYDFAQILASSIQSTEAIVGLLEIFVALGLAVGIAGMGIVALRAVAERRTEIGMLRAIGQTQRGILATFLLEYSYIALLGIGIGTGLGILLDFEASGGGVALVVFTVPWAHLALVVLVAYGLTVAAILWPSVKAARLPPAQSVRYSE